MMEKYELSESLNDASAADAEESVGFCHEGPREPAPLYIIWEGGKTFLRCGHTPFHERPWNPS